MSSVKVKRCAVKIKDDIIKQIGSRSVIGSSITKKSVQFSVVCAGNINNGISMICHSFFHQLVHLMLLDSETERKAKND